LEGDKTMKDDLQLLASVSVIALVSYGAYVLADLDQASIRRLNSTVKTLADTIGGPVKPEETPNSKLALYGAIAVLIVAALWIMLKGRR